MDSGGKRGATRVSLFLRSVRVLTDSAQMLCVLRDISATGLRLKLFHPLPATLHMAIDLGQGAIHFIEKVWEADGHAGFRFAAPVDVAAVIGDHTRPSRQPVSLELSFPAVIAADGQAALARVEEISQSGVRISCDRAFGVAQHVTVSADGFPVRSGTIEWRSHPEHGVVFQQGFAFDELARLAARLQDLTKDLTVSGPVDAPLVPNGGTRTVFNRP